MKRFLVVAVAVFVCVALSAQSKGDKYIALSASASFGSQNAEAYDGNYTSSQDSPLTTTACGQAEFGYFVSNNVRLALCLGVPYTSSPSQLSGSTWLKTKTVGFDINPNIAFYVPLADRLYYTPEIGFSYESGSYQEDVSASITYKADYSGFDIYASILALEFRATDKLAIGVGIGSIARVTAKIKDPETSNYLKTNQFKCDLNSASVHLRFYL